VIVRATEQWFISMETKMATAAVEQAREARAEEMLQAQLSGFEPMDAANPGMMMGAEAALLTGGLDEPRLADTPENETTFRQRALDAIKEVVWDPAWGEERISNMIATRPDWCISRQRIWGVPIAVFLCNKCHEPLNDPGINDSIVELFRRESADAWYIHPAEKLLPRGTKCAKCGNHDRAEFRKEMDILDVWFESGASWHAVLEAEPEQTFPADLYTEGSDQHRGWFHSSLLESVALRGIAPYRMVATSGWTLDEQGRAISKSLGNGVDPVEVAKKLGAEIIRLWVASVDFREDVSASENIMLRVGENYRKLRNTLRFLLGNLHGFEPETDAVAFAEMEPLDQYMLARMAELDAKIRTAYDHFEFHRAYHALNEFVNTDLSALYLDVLKDRLYTFAPKAKARRSGQTALWRIAEALTRLIAPILSFTADEVWALLPQVEGRESSVHVALFPDLADIVPGNESSLEAEWARLLEIRSEVLAKLEALRASKVIGKSLEAIVRIGGAYEPDAALLVKYFDALPELFNVSKFQLTEVENEETASGLNLEVVKSAAPKCERCWRYVEEVGNDARYPTVCLRCAEALEAIEFPPYEKESAA
jgi:isoleucyl-tRNA synthetase